MEKNLKQLLLKDICARLPYGVRVNYGGYEGCDYKLTLMTLQDFPTEDLKPYLRPMSGMTEEELYEVQEILGKEAEIRDGFISIIDSSIIAFTYLELQAVFEWFNTYHFDYRGLIEKGLAIEVTEENNPYKD